MSRNSKTESYRLLYSVMDIPVDIGYVAYAIMFYEGVGNLFPWNAFITASNYYSQRFCGTSFEGNFENFFSITYTLSQTIGLIFSVIYQNKISLSNKIIWPLLCYSTIFGITTLLVAIKDIDPTLLFWITLLSACCCGLCGALLSGGLFGLGAMFPPVYTAALMNGQGLAGLIVAVSGMLTSLASAPIDDCNDGADDSSCDQKIDYSALAYFIIATIILLSCILAYMALGQLHFTKFYISRAKGDEKETDVVSPLITEDEDRRFSDDNDDVSLGGRMSVIQHAHTSAGRASSAEVLVSLLEGDRPDESAALSFDKIWAVYRQIVIPSLSVFFDFTVTIGIFPSLIVLLESEHKCTSSNRFSNDLYVPFFFLMFNLFDFIGRVTGGATTPLFTDKNVWMAAAARYLSPLFIITIIIRSPYHYSL